MLLFLLLPAVSGLNQVQLAAEKILSVVPSTSDLHVCFYLDRKSSSVVDLTEELLSRSQGPVQVYRDGLNFGEYTVIVTNYFTFYPTCYFRMRTRELKVIVVAPSVSHYYFEPLADCDIVDVLLLVRGTFWTYNPFNRSTYPVETFDDKLVNLYGAEIRLFALPNIPWFVIAGGRPMGPNIRLFEVLSERYNARHSLVFNQFAGWDVLILTDMNPASSDVYKGEWIQGQGGNCIFFNYRDTLSVEEVLLVSFREKTVYVVLGVILLYLLAILVFTRTRRFRNSFNLYRVLVGQMDSEPPHRLDLTLLKSFEIFAFVLTNAYLSITISNLIVPPFKPQIETLDQFNRSNMTLVTPRATLLDLKALFDPHFMSHFVPHQLGQSFAQYSGVSQCDSFSYLSVSPESIKSMSNSIHKVKEKLSVNPLFFRVNLGKPIRRLMRRLIYGAHESGLWQFWLREIDRFNFFLLLKKERKKGVQEETKMVLLFKDLESFFWVFLGGQCLACLVFALEIVVFYSKKLVRFFMKKKTAVLWKNQ